MALLELRSTVKNLYLVATKHNEGKTLLSLGLIGALSKQGKRVGYLKPVGHANQDQGERRVDADTTLMKAACGLTSEIADISPLVLDGFPAELVAADGRERSLGRIESALGKASSGRDFVIIEGTANASAGACFGLSASTLARRLNAKIVLLAGGGVGQPADEVILNKGYFDREGIDVLGVVINKVYPHEFARLNSFMKPLLDSMKLTLFGAIPYDHDLARPTLRSLLEQFRGKVLNGADQLNAKVGRFVLGASGVSSILEQLQGTTTLLCPCDRDDVALAALAAATTSGGKGSRLQGIVFAGRNAPGAAVLQILKRTPVTAIQVEMDAYNLASMIHTTPYKMIASDAEALRRVGELVTKHVDVAAILERLKD